MRRLYAGELPERSVVLTFDDGTYDFYLQAYPLLKEFDYPATLYLTTFYSQYNRPVFDVACSYLLWKGRERTLDLKSSTGNDISFDLTREQARTAAFEEIKLFATEKEFSAAEKDELLGKIAQKLGVDYDNLLSRRILQLINPVEAKSLAADGIDVQRNTSSSHPSDRELFLKEIEDNRKSIEAMTGKSPTHFCYPSGIWDPAFLPWLSEAGIESATTCEIGLATPASNPLLLPRLLDVSRLSPIEFEGWLTGISTALPRR